MKNPSLGTIAIDLPVLTETRLLIQAAAGGGKSFALRRILEQTANEVQQIVIDSEGEFATLRERFDYIICAPSGADAVANPHTAAALALALWKAGTSAIIDIYELKTHERTLFVKRFLESLVNAPRSVWHQTLVVIDEIHVFAPQSGQAESTSAVIDLASRGRKRGLALIGATQRLSKLNKDVAAELLNKLIGRTGLDVDIQRAADELGMSRAAATEALRNLEPGEFFAYGPALTRAVERTRIGDVLTTHPHTGRRGLTQPPPASAAVLAQLAKIEGLQREAENEVKTVESLAAEVAALKRKLSLAAKPTAVVQGIPESEVKRRIADAIAALPAPPPPITKKLILALDKADLAMQAARKELSASIPLPPIGRAQVRTDVSYPPAPEPAAAPVSGLRSGAVRILQALAQRQPLGYSRTQLGALTGFSPKGGTFSTYLGDLRRAGFVYLDMTGTAYATESGLASLGDNIPAAPTSHAEVMSMWRRALRSGAFGMLEAVVRAGASGVGRQELAEAVGMTASGGTFTTYLGDLRRNSLIVERDKRCVANDILFP